ncbi:MAG: hypothetical protein QOH05_626, partial [Acetobacteraceae bacterium]|nr:hypothetical protein [Acetobacteraceae bacterium]
GMAMIKSRMDDAGMISVDEDEGGS